MISRLRDLDDWQVSDRDQDIRGWPVVDADGREIGAVDALLIDTDLKRAVTAVLDTGLEIPVSALEIGDNEVHVTRNYAAFSGPGSMREPHSVRSEEPLSSPAMHALDEQTEIERPVTPDADRRNP